MPRVSVVVPVHNAERHLRECLESIRSQTLDDIEVVLVDDGSTDGSAAIMAEFDAADPRFVVVPGPAEGSAGAARNTGLAAARGEYLSFLDADDFFAPTLLEELHEKAAADDADIVLSKYRNYDTATGDHWPAEWSLRLEYLPKRRPFAASQVADQLFFAVNPAVWNKLFRHSFVQRTGVSFQPLRRTNDACFTYLALAQAERITYLDRALVWYRTANEASLQGSVDESPLEFVQALEGIRSELQQAGLYEEFERGFVNQALAICLTQLKRPKTFEGFTAVYQALRSEVFPSLGILGRPPEYFLRADLPRRLAEVMELTPPAFLFQRLDRATDDLARARGEARRALREIPVRVAARQSLPDESLFPEPEESARPAADEASGPDVSVIVPVHNTEVYLRQCLDSVLRQSDVSLEVICVDDGSTDGSGALLDRYAGSDERVRVVHQVNAGLSAARNAALELAAGRYVCFLDSDDYWQVDALADLVRASDADDLDVLLFDATSIREDGVDETLWQEYREYYTRPEHGGVRTGAELVAALKDSRGYRASACLVLIRRRLLRSTGLRFYPGIAHEDNLFSFRLMLQAARSSHLAVALYARRIRPGSIVSASGMAVSARGYYVTCVEMFRTLAGYQTADERVAAAFGDLACGALRAARDAAAQLPEEFLEQLQEVDPAPDAQALYFLLHRAWRDQRDTRLLESRLKLATAGGAAWRRHPLVVKVKPRLKRLLGRQ